MTLRTFVNIRHISSVDIDECEELSAPCKGGSCLNLPGTFLCECPLGLMLSPDGQSCQG